MGGKRAKKNIAAKNQGVFDDSGGGAKGITPVVFPGKRQNVEWESARDGNMAVSILC